MSNFKQMSARVQKCMTCGTIVANEVLDEHACDPRTVERHGGAMPAGLIIVDEYIGPKWTSAGDTD